MAAYKVQIKIVRLQIFERDVYCSLHILGLMMRVPEFPGDLQVLADFKTRC
jgi:hypothetical protein